MKSLLLTLMVFSLAGGPAYGLVQVERQPGYAEQLVTEAEFRDAVEHAEELARGLQIGLKSYHEHLLAAMQRQGYGPYHPLFRTSLNGFAQDQIDLEALDEFKMGQFAFALQRAGKLLAPDPFLDWVEVQKRLDGFEATMNDARRVVARTNIFDATSDQNISPEIFKKMRKRWRVAVRQAADAQAQAKAVRAVAFEHGEMIPAEPNIRLIPGGGRYAVVCALNVCGTSQPTGPGGGVPPMTK